ncbi:hypothetical protein H0B56_18765 [Haloechinothrix sp. YIM 98757]|uniref:Uncharacterized protein n=1 Tax=Haloechinothrix aidingensis TaxID=2752311 RepID=A0A838AEF4_9PSEU|nr:hypothetical protein [Haloechinothrix aidingensis]MBA0127591.1 hypothetical protein [Haloechinothrix aidingensis]
MQKTVTISGTYAAWTLTLSVDLPEEQVEEPITEWPHKIDRVAEFFYDMVNCCEDARDAQLALNGRR